jgi:K+/H+ antiporter YhaU regulatory subunit KhtT
MLRDVRGLDELKIESARVREGSPAAGRSAVSLRLSSETGALVVGVRRGEQLLELDPTSPFEPGDPQARSVVRRVLSGVVGRASC